MREEKWSALLESLPDRAKALFRVDEFFDLFLVRQQRSLSVCVGKPTVSRRASMTFGSVSGLRMLERS